MIYSGGSTPHQGAGRGRRAVTVALQYHTCRCSYIQQPDQSSCSRHTSSSTRLVIHPSPRLYHERLQHPLPEQPCQVRLSLARARAPRRARPPPRFPTRVRGSHLVALPHVIIQLYIQRPDQSSCSPADGMSLSSPCTIARCSKFVRTHSSENGYSCRCPSATRRARPARTFLLQQLGLTTPGALKHANVHARGGSGGSGRRASPRRPARRLRTQRKVVLW